MTDPIAPNETPPDGEKEVQPRIEAAQAAVAANPNLAALAQALGAGLPYGMPPVGVPFQLPGFGVSQQTVQMWQGPHVPPEAAERYEAVLPGSFGRMLALTEELQAGQITASATAMQYMGRDTKRGHWLGFTVSVAAMVGAAWCVYMGNTVVAVAFLSVPVMAVGKALIDSSKSKNPASQASAVATQQLAAARTPQPTSPRA